MSQITKRNPLAGTDVATGTSLIIDGGQGSILLNDNRINIAEANLPIFIDGAHSPDISALGSSVLFYRTEDNADAAPIANSGADALTQVRGGTQTTTVSGTAGMTRVVRGGKGKAKVTLTQGTTAALKTVDVFTLNLDEGVYPVRFDISAPGASNPDNSLVIEVLGSSVIYLDDAEA